MCTSQSGWPFLHVNGEVPSPAAAFAAISTKICAQTDSLLRINALDAIDLRQSQQNACIPLCLRDQAASNRPHGTLKTTRKSTSRFTLPSSLRIPELGTVERKSNAGFITAADPQSRSALAIAQTGTRLSRSTRKLNRPCVDLPTVL